jgi:hypothetical protein
VVVRDSRASPGPVQDLIELRESESHRTHTHGRSVAETVVRRATLLDRPLVKHAAVPAVGIGVVVVMNEVGQGSAREDPLGHCDREDGIVRERRFGDEEGKVLVLVPAHLSTEPTMSPMIAPSMGTRLALKRSRPPLNRIA